MSPDTDANEEAIRALLRDGVPDHRGLDPDRVLAGGGRDGTRRGRRILAVAAAVVLVIAVAVVASRVGRKHDAQPALPSGPQNYSDLVLHNGDKIVAGGRVVSLPGKPVRLCPDAPFNDSQGTISGCQLGANLVGVDLDDLDQRHALGAAVEGNAQVTGHWRDGTIDVTSQRDRVTSTHSLTDTVPCSAPAGGWPDGKVDTRRLFRFGQQHRGVLQQIALLHPTSEAEVAFALTTGDPDPVMLALRSVYPDRLCVIRSKFTAAQVGTARRQLERLPGWMFSGTGLDQLTEQPQVEVGLNRVTARDAAIAARQPIGLVHLYAFLEPAR